MDKGWADGVALFKLRITRMVVLWVVVIAAGNTSHPLSDHRT